MKRWQGILGILGVLAGIGLTACGKAPVTRYYLLEATAGPQVSVDAPVVHVRPLTIEPPYDQDRIIYRLGAEDVRVRFYPYDRWAVPLDEMLSSVVATSLDGSGGMRFMRSNRTIAGSFQLNGHLVRLEEVDLPEGPQVRYRLDLTLTGPGGEVLFMERLENAGAAPAGKVDDVVRRMQSVLLADLVQLRPLVAAALQKALAAD